MPNLNSAFPERSAGVEKYTPYSPLKGQMSSNGGSFGGCFSPHPLSIFLAPRNDIHTLSMRCLILGYNSGGNGRKDRGYPGKAGNPLDLRSLILEKALIVPAILIGFTVHEYAHAKVANLLGDDTPYYQGRLTLNPLAHIDWIGFLALLLVGFGWAKPVQVNPRSFKNVRTDFLMVTVAGPLSNLVTAFASALLTAFLASFIRYAPNGTDLLFTLLKIIIHVNCILCVFNLLPIPPLDGYQILKTLVPAQYGQFFYNLERYQFFFLFCLVLIPGASIIITVPARSLYFLLTGWIRF